MNEIAQWFSDNIETIISSTQVIIGMGIIIFVHELGHFFFAKRVGCRIDVFSIGMGPRLFGFKKGETDYRVSLIPFGGYVKIFGQGGIEEKEGDKDDPRFFENKTPGQRFWVFVAGVMMNFLIAIPLFILVNYLGQNVPNNTITDIEPGSPAFEAGIEKGDKLLSMVNSAETDAAKITPEMWENGKTETWEPVNRRLMTRKDQENLWLKIKRDDKEQTIMLSADKLKSKEAMMYLSNTGMKGAERWLAVASLNDDSPGKGKLKPKDIILKINNTEIKNGHDLRHALNAILKEGRDYGPSSELQAKPSIEAVRVTIKREIDDNQYKESTFENYQPKIMPFFDLPITLYNKPIVGVLQQGSTAANAGLKKDDVITQFGIDKNMVEIECWNDIEKTYERFKDTPDVAFFVKTQRDREPVALQSRGGKNVADAFGIYFPKGLYIKSIPDLSPLFDLSDANRPRVGDQIIGIDQIELEETFVTPEQMKLVMSSAYNAKDKENTTKKISISFRRYKGGEIKSVGLRLMLNYRPVLGFTQTDGVMPDSLVLNNRPFGEAVVKGLTDPYTIIKLTAQVFSTKRIGIGQVSGPVGIFVLARRSAEASMSSLLYILAFISINLAVLNILPIPVLDGGHIMFLIIEKIRGKRLSEKIRGKMEIVGLVALLSLIVMAFKNDIFMYFVS